MSNSVNLSLDVTKTGIQNPLIKVRQGDGGFETLRTTVTANGEPMDLQGWTITFMGTTAGNHKIVDGNVTLVEAPNGVFDYTPSKAWGMDIGEFKIAYFKFIKGNGAASSANFRVNVIEAVDLTQEEAQNYISVVDTTIAEINQHLNDSLANVTQSIADANNNANTVASNVTALGNRVNDYNNKLAAIKVGGRNLLLGTSDWSGGSARWNQRGTVTSNVYRGTLIAATSSPWKSPFYLLQNAGILQVGKTYTFSTYVRNTSDTDTNVAIYYEGGIVTPVRINNPLPAHTDWTRVSTTFKVIKDPTTSTDGLRWEGQSDLTNGQIQFAGYKLEEGNVATDWTPAPEDAPSNDAQLVHKTGTETIPGDKTFIGKVNFAGNVNIVSATTRGTILDGYDLNGYLDTYNYVINGANNLVNYPSDASNYATLEVEKINASTSTQRLTDTNNHIFTRTFGGNPAVWSTWYRVVNYSDISSTTVNNKGVNMTFKKFGNIVTVIGSGSYTGGDVNAFTKISDGVVPSGYLPAGTALINANWGSNIGQMAFDVNGAWLHRGPSTLSNGWVFIAGSWSV